MGEDSALILAQYIAKDHKLEYFDISENSIDGKGFEQLLKAIKIPAKSGYLKYLDISQNCAEDGYNVRALSDIISNAQKLEVLCMDEMRIERGSHQTQIIDAIKQNESLF